MKKILSLLLILILALSLCACGSRNNSGSAKNRITTGPALRNPSDSRIAAAIHAEFQSASRLP